MRARRVRTGLFSAFPLCLALCLGVPAPAHAWQDGLRTEGDVASAQGLYSGEVPVTSQTDQAREAGFARALAQVLGKLSGDANVAARPGVSQELRNAAGYVDGYDYRQDQGTSPGGAPTFRTILVVRFVPESVDALTAALGLPLWPQPRPKPVLWLAIDDGSGPRLLGTGQANAARPLLERAIERGYRLGLPAGSAAEQAAVGAIWRDDPAAVARASARYDPPMQLIGKMYRGDAGWVTDWTFVDAGRVLATRSVSEGDPRRALASGADVAADALIKRYARVPPSEPAGTYRVAFTGLRSADDYLRVSALLQRLPVVRRVAPVRAAADRIEFDLDLLTGLSGFERMFGADAPVVAVEGVPAEYRMR
ncbi:hypothetical protein B1992_14165 [Pseudoxanthomonas broegbernensis]|uniref:DUF2066 domain-containing protein n=1 Tax=Pseudoxanthomonas broegbernensis TaxID=83619 RepID=A0A7V8GKB3_9GAMM|nr:DUF2066 domain-containing protein [Pseudoxanthomonas broegbernensis]KAF1684857.1 hypothetical protein B1992_14165 [Pseudoxanthomonas broegbernensis]MBB6065267.1 hypothetical protein [Pseudoxanthomonas broegbernensis]